MLRRALENPALEVAQREELQASLAKLGDVIAGLKREHNDGDGNGEDVSVCGGDGDWTV